MARNGSGTYSLPAGNPVVTGTTISSTVHNNTLSDIATALTGSLARDGQSPPTANLPMAGYKHTGVGNATARDSYASAAQSQDSSLMWATAGGTTDVITLTTSPATTAHTTGQVFRFVSSGANTTNVTVNPNAIGAKALTKNGTTALIAGDIPSGAVCEIVYDGTQYQLLNVLAVGPTATQTLSNKTINNTNTVTLKDTLFTLQDDGDATKLLAFQLSGITTATTRTVTIPNKSGTMAMTSDIPSVPSAASQAEIEAAVVTDKYIPPGLLKYYPTINSSLTRVTVSGGTPTLINLKNFSSVTDNGVGDLTATMTDGYSLVASMAPWVSIESNITTLPRCVSFRSSGIATGSVRCLCADFGGTLVDPESWTIGIAGDFA